jgi:hypothetical protein
LTQASSDTPPASPECRYGATFWTSIVVYMPVTALSVYFGSCLEEIKATDPLVIGAVVALLALLVIDHFIVRRQAAAVNPA